MSKQIFESKWECPICREIGKKWIVTRNARKNGRTHIRRFHNRKNIDPIIHRRRVRQNDKN